MKEKLKKRIIELIHGLPYDEAIEIEVMNEDSELMFEDDVFTGFSVPKITIGRVLQALDNSGNTMLLEGGYIFNAKAWRNGYGEGVLWKLTKENGEECDLNDQSEETIEALYKLLK